MKVLSWKIVMTKHIGDGSNEPMLVITTRDYVVLCAWDQIGRAMDKVIELAWFELNPIKLMTKSNDTWKDLVAIHRYTWSSNNIRETIGRIPVTLYSKKDPETAELLMEILL